MNTELNLTLGDVSFSVDQDGKAYSYAWQKQTGSQARRELSEGDARMLLVFAQAVIDKKVNGV